MTVEEARPALVGPVAAARAVQESIAEPLASPETTAAALKILDAPGASADAPGEDRSRRPMVVEDDLCVVPVLNT